MLHSKPPTIQIFILLIGYIACIHQCSLTPQRNITMKLQKPTHIQYSHTQSYLAVANQSVLQVHDGITGKFKWRKQYLHNQKINKIQFSCGEQWIGVGFSSSDSKQIRSQFISVQSPAFVQPHGQQIYTVDGDQEQTDSKYSVVGVLFLHEQFFITATIDNVTVRVVHTGQKKYYQFNDGTKIQSIEQTAQNAIVYALEYQGGLFFNFYQMNHNAPVIDLVKSVAIDKQNLTNIHDLCSNSNYNKLYFIGDTNQVYYMNLLNYQIYVVVEVQSNGALHKIQVTQDQNIIMVTNDTHLILLERQQKQQQKQVSDGFGGNQYAVTNVVAIFNGVASMSNIAGNIVYLLETDHIFQVSGVCQQGQYRDYENSHLLCKKCLPSQCVICQKNINKQSPTCRLCPDRYYLQQQFCYICSDHCLQCDSEYCQKCQLPFIEDAKSCVCPGGQYEQYNTCVNCVQHCWSCQNSDICISCRNGYYIDDDKLCQRNGLSLLTIILTAGFSVIGVAIISFVIYRYCLAKIRNREHLYTQQQL